MSVWLLSAMVMAQLAGGAPEPAVPRQVADGADLIIERGDSRRPRLEVPSIALPSGRDAAPASIEGAPADVEGDQAPRGPKGFGTQKSGDLYFPSGDHRPGDLDNQGTFRPGDLG